MFLKHLILTNTDGLVRRVDFRMGMNLIVDDTPRNTSDTGNNVGKTTLLRLIDFCLNGEPKDLYTSTDNLQNKLVKDYLRETELVVELCLVESLFDPDSRKVVIRRNFKSGKKCIRHINDRFYEKNDFEQALQYELWGIRTGKPTFREIISHSIRISDDRLSQPLRTITSYQPVEVYESLHMFLFGANIEDAERKVELNSAIKADRAYKKRMEKSGTLSELRSTFGIVKNQIAELEAEKSSLKLNPDFEKDLSELTELKHQLSILAVRYNNINLRRTLIKEAAQDLNKYKSQANADQIAEIYRQAGAFPDMIHHTFEELLNFHNGMMERRENFIVSELPGLEKEIKCCNEEIDSLRKRERALEVKLNLSVNFETFDDLISKITEKYQQLGTIEQKINQILEIEEKIAINKSLLQVIDQDLFTESRKNIVQAQLDKFNLHFSTVSQKLYDESYAIGYEIEEKDGKQCYKFYPFAADNFSTGKKQGETTCFDLAYVTFADEEQIPCLHFILNDKKELMDDNQLIRIAEWAESRGDVQYVASILRDKLPDDLTANKYIVQTLSKYDRLFKIEDSTWWIAQNKNVKQ